MAIIQGPCDSFRLQMASAVHDFSSDTFKIALYSSSADLGPDTTVYTTTGEVVGSGYVAGGATLTPTISVSNRTVIVDFADVSWLASTITARGALIYNSTEGNKAVWVLNFGLDRVTSNATFPIVFPPADNLSGLIRW